MRDESKRREERERLGTIASSRAADQAHHCDIVHTVCKDCLLAFFWLSMTVQCHTGLFP